MFEILENELKARGITKMALASRMGVAQSDLYSALKGRKPMYAGYKKRIAEILGMQEAELFPTATVNKALTKEETSRDVSTEERVFLIDRNELYDRIHAMFCFECISENGGSKICTDCHLWPILIEIMNSEKVPVPTRVVASVKIPEDQLKEIVDRSIYTILGDLDEDTIRELKENRHLTLAEEVDNGN